MKKAVAEQDWVKVKEIMVALGKKKKSLVNYLVKKGYASVAIDMVETL